MIQRTLESKLKESAEHYPVVSVTGPRQSGKTTLCRKLFPQKPYLSFEAPDIRELALQDPRGFLARYPDGAVLDEVQRVPEILSYLQGIVDERKQNGLYILSGSQNFYYYDLFSSLWPVALRPEIITFFCGRNPFFPSKTRRRTTSSTRDFFQGSLIKKSIPPTRCAIMSRPMSNGTCGRLSM